MVEYIARQEIGGNYNGNIMKPKVSELDHNEDNIRETANRNWIVQVRVKQAEPNFQEWEKRIPSSKAFAKKFDSLFLRIYNFFVE